MLKHAWRAFAATVIGAAGWVAFGVAADGAGAAGTIATGPFANGTLFVADQSCPCVWEVQPGGSPFIFAGSDESPQSVAVDAAGDVFWTQLDNGTVDERTAVGSTLTLASGFEPTGVAVDAAGDVYFGSFGAGGNAAGLYEIPNGGSPTLVTSRFGEFESVAIDGNGDVWGVASADNLVVVPPGTSGAAINIAGTEFDGVSLDSANNLFASTAFDDNAVEVAAGSVSATNLGTIGTYTEGVAVDGSDDVFVGAPSTVWPNGKVYKIPHGGSPGLYATDVATTNGLALYPPPTPSARSSSSISATTSNSSSITTQTAVHLTATVPSGESGAVQFDDNGSPIGVATATSGGKASITTHLSAGSHAVTATYLGDATHAPAVSNTLSFTSKSIATKTVLTFPSGTTVAGDAQLAVDAQVTGHGGVPTGYVTFYDGSKDVGTATLTNGDASFAFYTNPGSSKVYATYSGDTTFGRSTSARTTVTTTTPYRPSLRTTVKYGRPNTKGAVKATIKVTVGGVATEGPPAGTITASDGFTCSALTPVPRTVTSVASCSHRLRLDVSETVTLVFSTGNGDYISSSTRAYVSNYSDT